MKNIIISIVAICALSSCSVCHVTSAYNYATDSAEICLKCDKVSKNLLDAIATSKTIKLK